MRFALDAISFRDLIFLNSSQADQNSMFSSQNSDLRKIQNAIFPSAWEIQRGRRERLENYFRHTYWLFAHSCRWKECQLCFTDDYKKISFGSQ